MSDQVQEAGFTPIRPNPYIVGNPIRDRSMFFGRQAEFELVRNRFQHSAHGGLLVFCGERRSGKTSILFQILDRRLGVDFIPVLIDMQSMAISDDADFLEKVTREIARALGSGTPDLEPPAFAPGANHPALFQEFIEQVLRQHPSKKLMLLFDEYELFENKIDAGVLAEDVLLALASLMEHHPVFVIFTGSQHLEQRKRAYWRILGKSIYKQISYLERDDAESLIRKPVEGRVDYGPGTVEAIYRLTAGQPFYTQAICQNLVDGLNERATGQATREILAGVVAAMVDNPLPQMIFLWDSLERDEKLVMALLAECVPDEDAFAQPGALSKLIRQREYPLELDNARIATALEKLFKAELLLKQDATHPPGYAFRMDLWRLWIRRMHSVWQVMREEGLEIRPRRLARRTRAALLAGAGAVVVLAALAAWVYPGFLKGRATAAGGGAAAASARLRIEADPDYAMVFHDGVPSGIGVFVDRIDADRDHGFRFTAEGYADTQFSVRLDPGADETRRVTLSPLTGGLRIQTAPPGAEITVDGVRRGRSPVVVDGLAVPREHAVTASLPGRNPVRSGYRVRAGETIPVTLSLDRPRVAVLITTTPRGAEITVDGVAHGPSPVQLQAVDLGTHTIGARSEGHVPRDTTLEVRNDTGNIHIAMAAEPPGVLVVQGDLPARMYVDDILVVEGVQNSGRQELRRGPHRVRVVLPSGETIDRTVTVEPDQRVVFDYSSGTVRRAPLGGTQP